MSLVVFTVSTLGTLGPEAAKLVAALSQATCPALFSTLPAGPARALAPSYARPSASLRDAASPVLSTKPTARSLWRQPPLLVPAVRAVGPAAAQAYFLEFPALPAAVAGPAGPAPALVVP